MSARLLDGRALAQQIRATCAQTIRSHPLLQAQIPGLAVILIGENSASEIYVNHKQKACEQVGIRSLLHRLPADCTQDCLIELIDALNADQTVDGILVQLPLPSSINVAAVIARIAANKDVDGFHPYNIGCLVQRTPRLRPCTPYGVMRLLANTGIDLHGLNAVVVGASNIVGRPMVLELLLAGCTVTVCHRFTPPIDLIRHLSQAQLVVSAVGKPYFIKGEWINRGAIVIDVGISRLANGTLCGDVEFDVASQRAAYITPVPGGVGPMTVACLIENTLTAALTRRAGASG